MPGGTLVVSRATLLEAHHKKRFEELGFKNVTVTAKEKDGLDMLIRELKPKLIIMGAGFYKSATPYMAGEILRRFKGLKMYLNIAVVSISLEPYPADYGMSLINNGVKSYINLFDGMEQFYDGLASVRDGHNFISASVQERMDIRDELPRRSSAITDRELEVLRFLRDGFFVEEIAKELPISVRTVIFHKKEMYGKFSVRNERELIRVAEYLKLVKQDEPHFYGRNFELSPKPNKKKLGMRNEELGIKRAISN
jgi:DNA-binding NarL/FixJ family response regulator